MVSIPAITSGRRWQQGAALGLLLALALGLRLYGITWGLPNRDRVASYHPDEGVNLVGGVLDRGVARPHLDLAFYNYGTVYFYAWQAAASMNSVYGGVQLADGGGKASPDSAASLILVGRLLTALAGVVTVGLLYFLGLRLYGQAGALGASAAYALYPLAVVHGHFATVDVMAALVCLAAVWTAWRATATRATARFLVSGVVVGIAAATKYTSVAFISAPLWAALDAPSGTTWGARCRAATSVVAGAALGFLVACPGVWMSWPRFAADVGYEVAKSREGMGLLFVDTGNGWVYHLVSSLRYGMGLPLLLIAVVALGAAMLRRDPSDRLLVASVVPYYLAIGLAQVRFMRYVLPLLPVLSLIIGGFVARAGCCQLLQIARRTSVALALTFTLAMAAALSGAMAGVDARDRAVAYLRSRPRQGPVGFATTPWYWSPPLLPCFTQPGSFIGRRNAILSSDAGRGLRLSSDGHEWDLSVATDPTTSSVVVSNIESQDALRLHRPEALGFMAALRERYTERVFETRPHLLGLDWPSASGLPNDLLYILPRISVWERRRGG